MSPPPTIDLEGLGLDRGGHVVLKHALAGLATGERLEVRGWAPGLAVHLGAWCRSQGHGVVYPDPPAATGRPPNGNEATAGPVAWVVRGSAVGARWRGAERAGRADPTLPGAVAERPSPTWGLAARGARVETGGPQFSFPLDAKATVWTDDAARIYRQAAAAQWDPSTAVSWDTPFELAPEVEAAVVQVMTYLVENENAALAVPARFLGRIHPHFREVVQVLAVQIADEARHVEVFTRRALLKGGELGLSSAGGQASLLTLLEEPDFALAHFLLSVLGEGTFLALLSFLEHHAPDPVTRRVAHLALADEARHVAFGMAHLGHVLADEPSLRSRLTTAIHRRHDALAHTAGLNEEVFDALVVLAAGSMEPADIAEGFARVQDLQAEMGEGRRRRLARLGFPAGEAAVLSALHTRNFM
ncbi:MAG: ferritin-like domain-containing protein [Actinomycetota bacterium]|nr:ferritin-like domain-containing protein [Actinomycetota bacterium]